MNKFFRDETGATLVEYTVLLSFVLVGVIGTILLVGDWVGVKWQAVYCALSGGSYHHDNGQGNNYGANNCH